MFKRYKLHCFHCCDFIKDKDSVFRTPNNHPICEGCASDYLENDGWDDPDWVLERLKREFKGKIKKFYKDLELNFSICKKCGLYWKNIELIKIGSSYYCDSCIEWYESEIKSDELIREKIITFFIEKKNKI